LGAGPEPIPQKKLTVDRLANALHSLKTDTSMYKKAEALVEQIRREDGVANAVNIIEGVLSRYARITERPAKSHSC
jgi:sterol 3beta-glucosyltransferase